MRDSIVAESGALGPIDQMKKCGFWYALGTSGSFGRAGHSPGRASRKTWTSGALPLPAQCSVNEGSGVCKGDFACGRNSKLVLPGRAPRTAEH